MYEEGPVRKVVTSNGLSHLQSLMSVKMKTFFIGTLKVHIKVNIVERKTKRYLEANLISQIEEGILSTLFQAIESTFACLQ